MSLVSTETNRLTLNLILYVNRLKVFQIKVPLNESTIHLNNVYGLVVVFLNFTCLNYVFRQFYKKRCLMFFETIQPFC